MGCGLIDSVMEHSLVKGDWVKPYWMVPGEKNKANVYSQGRENLSSVQVTSRDSGNI